MNNPKKEIKYMFDVKFMYHYKKIMVIDLLNQQIIN